MAHGTKSQTLVLREYFVVDHNPNAEGPPNATVTVAGDSKVLWTFREPGQRGEAVTANLYMVTTFGCCGAPNVYTYFSLADRHKVRSA